MVYGMLLRPWVVDMPTVARNEKVLSAGVTSPLVPSSNIVWVSEPPIADRSMTTARPVLAGLVAGVTATVRSEFPPAGTALGFALPTPVSGPAIDKHVEFRFCGRLGVINAKSAELLSVSCVLPPAPPGFRS